GHAAYRQDDVGRLAPAFLGGTVAEPAGSIRALRSVSSHHGQIPIVAKKMANTPSTTITMKIDFTTDIVVCRPSDSADPCTLSPSTQATSPTMSAMNRALTMPTIAVSSVSTS